MAARPTNSPGDWPSGAIGGRRPPRPNRAPHRRVGAACRPGCLAKCKEVGERARQITLDTCRRNAKRPAKFPRWEEFALGWVRPHPRSRRQNQPYSLLSRRPILHNRKMFFSELNRLKPLFLRRKISKLPPTFEGFRG